MTGRVAAEMLAAVLALTACTSSFGSSHRGALHDEQGGGVAGHALHAKVNTPYELDMRQLCTANGKPIHITKVTPWKPRGGIRIVDWGVRVEDSTAATEVVGEAIKVSQLDGFTTGPVTVACSSKIVKQAFFVSVATSGGKLAAMYGATIEYGDHQKLNSQMSIIMCTTVDVDHCQPPKGYE